MLELCKALDFGKDSYVFAVRFFAENLTCVIISLKELILQYWVVKNFTFVVFLIGESHTNIYKNCI